MEIVFSPPKYTDGKVIALADIELAEGIVVRGFKIVDCDNGLFAAVPSRSFMADGKTKWYPLVVFSSPELKEGFQSEVLDRYHHWNKNRDSMEQAPLVEMKAGNSDRDESAPPF